MRIGEDEYRRRIEVTRAAMDAAGFDALVAYAYGSSLGGVIYLTGYEPILQEAYCVLSSDSCHLVLAPYEHVMSNGSTWLPDSEIVRTFDPPAAVSRLLRTFRKIGIAGHAAMPARVERILSTDASESIFEPTLLLDEVRRIKSDAELEIMRHAASVTDSGARTFMEEVKAGITEIELASRIEQAMRARGVERFASPVILASGARTLEVTFIPTAKRIEVGDIATHDCAARVFGYWADMARGTVVGEPTQAQRRLLETVVLMYREGFKLLVPGGDARLVHRRAKEVAEDAGYDYPYETGHAIGCDAWELPQIDEAPDEVPIEAGMVVAIEPGLYIAEVGGVRIENTILITEEGPTELTTTPLEPWH